MAETTRAPEIQAIYNEMAATARTELAKRGQDFTPEALDSAVEFVVQTYEQVNAMHLDAIDDLVAKLREQAAAPKLATVYGPGLRMAADILAYSVEGER